MRFGQFNTSAVTVMSAQAAWIRWRLIDELMSRYYCDVGLEPAFGLMGTEQYQVALSSPTCRRAPRYFGRLCGTGVHPEDDCDILPDEMALHWAGLATEGVHDGPWSSWSEYRRAAIQALGLDRSGVPGHENCFHRRGKALTHLMFRVGLLLRTNGGHELMPPDDAMLTIGSWHNSQYDESTVRVVEIIHRVGGEVPPGPPRFTAVRNEELDWVALRTDGWIATAKGDVDAADLWRAGASEGEIAGAVHTLCTT